MYIASAQSKVVLGSEIMILMGSFYSCLLYILIQTLLMGCISSSQGLHGPLNHIGKDQILNVATLNYCGILKSPFQFYSGNYHEELKKLSAIFETLKKKYVNVPQSQPFAWEFRKLDKRIKEQRYCSLYNLSVGIVDGKFISKERFCKLWKQKLDKAVEQGKFQLSSSDREEALQFDLLVFHTLLHYVYKVDDINQMQNKESTLYLQTFQPFFKQAFLDEDKKLSIFLQGLETAVCDVIFIQQANEKLISALSSLQDYIVQVSADKDTLICARKNSFTLFTPIRNITQLNRDEMALVNWNSHSSIMIADQYILISGHLDSNKKSNMQNIEDLKKGFKTLREKHPSYQVICGADINSFLPEFDTQIFLYPIQQKKFTSLKMRTSMQTQSNKAEVASKESKDKIISTLPIIKGSILTIDLQPSNEHSYLPLDSHPFDHFLLFAKVMKQNQASL